MTMKKIQQKRGIVVGKVGSDYVNSSLDELLNYGDPSGKPTIHDRDDLPNLVQNEKTVAAYPPGVNNQYPSKKKMSERNDFMGSEYKDIVKKVKRDMSRRALRDISIGGDSFKNEIEK